MRFVTPTVRLIARTEIENNNVAAWLNQLGCEDTVVDKYACGENKTEGERLVELAGRRCYLSFEPGLNPNVNKIRTDIVAYINNVLDSGHGSVCEHYWLTFSIENVSRVFTGEMNRHRAGTAISEGSMRYIRFNDIPIVMPPCIDGISMPSVSNMATIQKLREGDKTSLEVKKHLTRWVFQQVAESTEYWYEILLTIWADELAADSKFSLKKQITSMIRRIVPMGVATGGVWSFNLRSLRHICELRTTPAAEEEIALVVGHILEIMMQEEPTLFGDFTMLDGYWAPKYHKV